MHDKSAICKDEKFLFAVFGHCLDEFSGKKPGSDKTALNFIVFCRTQKPLTNER
jgi:hypothetical protein